MRVARLIRWALIALLILFLLLVGAVLWLGSSGGRDQALSLLSSLAASAGVTVQTNGASGSLGRELQLQSLRVQSGDTRIEAQNVTLGWQPMMLFSGKLIIDSLHAETLVATVPPGEPPAPTLEPVTLPQAVTLPIGAEIESIAVGTFILRAASSDEETLRLTDISANLNVDETRLRVGDASVSSAYGRLDVSDLNVGLNTPYPIRLEADFAGSPGGHASQARLRASGDAQRLTWSLQGKLADARLEGEGIVRALQPLPAYSLRLNASGFDPSRFAAAAPGAALDLSVELDNLRQSAALSAGDPRPQNVSLQGRLEMGNAAPGPSHAGRLPVHDLRTGWALDWTGKPATSRLALGNLAVALTRTDDDRARVAGDVYASLAPVLDFGPWQLPEAVAVLDIEALDLGVFSAAVPTRLGGRIELRGRQLQASLGQAGRPGPVGEGDPAAAALRERADLDLRARLGVDNLEIERLQFSLGKAAVRAAGELGVRAPYRSALAGQLHHLRPLQFVGSDWPGAARWRDTELNAGFGIQAQVGEDAVSALTLNVTDSRLGGKPLRGLIQGTAHLAEGTALSRLDALTVDMRHGKDRWRANGALGRADDSLALDVAISDLAALADGVSGDLALEGELRGRFNRLSAKLSARSASLSIGAGAQAQGSTAIRRLALSLDAPLSRQGLDTTASRMRVNAARVQVGAERIDDVSLAWDGRLPAHELRLGARAREHRLDATLSGALALQGEGFADPRWRGALEGLRVDGALNVRQRDQASIAADAAGLDASNLVLSAAGGRLSLSKLALVTDGGRVLARGQWQDLALEALLAPAGVSLPDDVPKLSLSGGIDLSGAGPDDLNGSVELRVAELSDGNAARVLGGRNRLEARLTDGVIDGLVELTVPSLAFTRRWTGDEIQVDGSLSLNGDLSGPLLDPRIDARLTGRELQVRQPTLGWLLERGSLRARLQDRRLELEQLRLASGEGLMTLTGEAALLARDAAKPGAIPLDGRFELTADQLAVPLGPGQRIVLDGSTRFDSDADGMTLTGALRAREGRIEIASSGAPTLPDDIDIVDAVPPATASPDAVNANEAQPKSQAPPIRTDLKIDLGEQIRVVGAGVDARLGGELAITGELPGAPSADGTVRLIEGAYTAYGQDLSVSRGNIRFNGPIDNPVLDLKAIRPKLPVEVGVVITGNALNPVIELFSSPAMSDAEKLSWLVLGAPLDDASSAAQSLALQQAALTLVGRDDGSISGGGLADKLGLERIGFGYASSTGQQEVVSDAGSLTGLPGAQQSSSQAARDEVVTVSKRLSSRLRVSYEQGVRGVWNLLRLQYELNDRLSLRAQTGSDSAIDLLYFFSFD